MSVENVELVRQWGEALSRGELPLELSHPELRLDNIAEFPNTGPYLGREGLRRWWQDVADAFDEIRFEIERLIDVDDERVLSVQRTIGRFRHTAIPIDNRWASLYWVREGKIARAVGYASERRALEAAGLREDAISEENVEIVRRAYEAFNRGDMDGAFANISPEFEYVATGAIPGMEGVVRAPEGFRGFLESWWGEFDEPRVEIHELIETGDQVVASLTFRGRGKQSGVETTWDIWQAWTIRHGKAVRGRGFMRREEALESARLRE
jgi:ketosteroid isomerase-like protein